MPAVTIAVPQGKAVHVTDEPGPQPTPRGEANVDRLTAMPQRYGGYALFFVQPTEQASIADLDAVMQMLRCEGVAVNFDGDFFGGETAGVWRMEVRISEGVERVPAFVRKIQSHGFAPILDRPQLDQCHAAGVAVDLPAIGVPAVRPERPLAGESFFVRHKLGVAGADLDAVLQVIRASGVRVCMQADFADGSACMHRFEIHLLRGRDRLPAFVRVLLQHGMMPELTAPQFKQINAAGVWLNEIRPY